MSSRARHVALVIAGALFVFLTAQISIRLPGTPIPVTGQVFGVLLVGGALGFRRGMLAMLLYVAIGVIGYPAFAEHKGGIQVLATVTDGRLVLGSSGGYLVGFIVAGSLVGWLAELGWDRHLLGALAAMVLGDAAIYLIGVPWLMAALNLSLADGIAKGLVPFLLWDAVKIGLAAGLFPAAWWVVGRRPGER
ncbi:MAG: biotin transporter BioY [Chloroflexi bacterium]|nr:MAG: biotin transporter BioY [Chloroflexota bacterium]